MDIIWDLYTLIGTAFIHGCPAKLVELNQILI